MNHLYNFRKYWGFHWSVNVAKFRRSKPYHIYGTDLSNSWKWMSCTKVVPVWISIFQCCFHHWPYSWRKGIRECGKLTRRYRHNLYFSYFCDLETSQWVAQWFSRGDPKFWKIYLLIDSKYRSLWNSTEIFSSLNALTSWHVFAPSVSLTKLTSLNLVANEEVSLGKVDCSCADLI